MYVCLNFDSTSVSFLRTKTGITRLAYLLTNLLTYLLTYSLHGAESFSEASWFCQSVMKFPAFYETRSVITAFTSARHLSLSWATSIQSIPSHRTSWSSVLILSSILCLCFLSGSFPQVSPPKHCVHLYSPPFVLHSPPTSFIRLIYLYVFIFTVRANVTCNDPCHRVSTQLQVMDK